MEASGDRASDLVLVKLGGSLLTDKERPETPRTAVIRRLAAELAEALPELPEALLLGHGSGSFGHAAARRHGLGGEERIGPEGRRGVAETQAAAARLHRRVTAALAEAGVPVYPVAPSSGAVARAGSVVSLAIEPVDLALRLGLVPLVYGDVAMDRALGATVLSTETVLEAAAERLEARGWRIRRALWLGATDGVYGPAGEALPEVWAGAAEAALRAAGAAAGADVTGGMAHRLETALRLAGRGIPSWIGDGRAEGALAEALRGRPAGGTRVLPPAAEEGPGPASGPTR